MEDILLYDKEYTDDKFKTYVDNVFIQIYTSLMTKEIENIEHFVSNSVYQLFINKINNLNEKGLTQMYDQLNVKSTNIIKKEKSDNKLIIEVEIISRYKDYIIDENGKKISGDDNERIQKTNILTFEKNINIKNDLTAPKCPGCGANMDINASGKCKYCGTIYNLERSNWILTNIIEVK